MVAWQLISAWPCQNVKVCSSIILNSNHQQVVAFFIFFGFNTKYS